MNVFHEFTKRSLKKNRVRTIITIIGIVLSMSLFTAVTEGAYSGIQFLMRAEIERRGNFHFYMSDLSSDEYDAISENKAIKSESELSLVGWAEIGSKNDYKPYLMIMNMADDTADYITVNLTQGRYPENKNEIILPVHLNTNGGVNYKLGDVLELEVGKRVSEGYELTSNNAYIPDEEEIKDPVKKTYTVVGFYDRLSTLIEQYECPGYTALTKGDTVNQNFKGLLMILKNPRQWPKLSFEFESMTDKGVLSTHKDLLNSYGVTGNDGINAVISGFATVLMFLICFGSISLIYNAFAITVSERTKQYGILKSVGATKKQIGNSVLYEAMLLSFSGIAAGALVGCVGIGITLYCLRDSFAGFLYNVSNVQMKLVVHPLPLLIAALMCFVTTIISAWIPAKRAIKVSPISSIRQNQDILINGKDVRTSKLTEKVFGFEGMMAAKNFKRNKRRYRAVVLSLFMSVVLFIASSSFCSYLTNAVANTNYNDRGYDISYYVVGDTIESSDHIMDLLNGVKGVESSFSLVSGYYSMTFPKNIVNNEYLKYYDYEKYENSNVFNTDVHIFFVDNEYFNKLCAENNLKKDAFYDNSNPKGILFNTKQTYVYDDDKVFFIKINMLDTKDPNFDLSVYSMPQIDGYCLEYEEYDENGDSYLYYFDEDYVMSLYKDGDYKDSILEIIDKSKAMVVKKADIEERIPLKIGAVVNNSESVFVKDSVSLVYPMEYIHSISLDKIGDNNYFNERNFFFNVKDHKTVYNEMKNLLLKENYDTTRLYDYAEGYEEERMMITVINVFSYGFIILISLIALTNVFNTISTSISLRTRELAMLKSIGMSRKGFRRMMNYECIIYGVRGLLFGLPVSVLVTYFIYRVTTNSFIVKFYIPFSSVVIAVGSVFIVVFAAMFYSMRTMDKQNTIDALKSENI